MHNKLNLFIPWNYNSVKIGDLTISNFFVFLEKKVKYTITILNRYLYSKILKHQLPKSVFLTAIEYLYSYIYLNVNSKYTRGIVV